jgi:hypothetical protein
MKKKPIISLAYDNKNTYEQQKDCPTDSTYPSMRATSLGLLLAIYFGLHSLIALTSCKFELRELHQRLTHLDSNWYLQIAEYGYRTHPNASNEASSALSQYAFLPLWPLTLRALSFLLGKESLAITGALISFTLLIIVLVVGITHRRSPKKDNSENILYSANFIGVFYTLFSPGSWVFLSNHTESLFFFLSFFAFHFISQRRVFLASCFSGLATLTRNQGILVAVTVGLIVLQDNQVPFPKRAARFLFIGMTSLGFYACWLLFLYVQTGDIFTSSRAQTNWRITTTWQEYLSNASWLSPNNAPRAALFWTILVIGTWLLIKGTRKYRYAIPLGFYFISSALLWPLQGNNFPQAYRFASVLFPFWNIMGLKTERFLTKMNNSARMTVMTIIFLAMIFIAGIISTFYHSQAPNTWPY